MPNTINIRPTVGYLGVLSRINYTPYHAMAEFVDNSIQSFVDNKLRLKKLHSNYKLKINGKVYLIYFNNEKEKIHQTNHC